MLSRRHTSAYIEQKPGSQMALSKTMEMVSPSVSASSMPSSRSCSMSRSNFSGVILFRMPLMARVVFVRASSDAPRLHACSALTISAPAVPSGRGVRSTRPEAFLPPEAFFAASGLACQSASSLFAADLAPAEPPASPFAPFASASFLPHCAAAVSPSCSAPALTSLITTSIGDVASSTGISEQRCEAKRKKKESRERGRRRERRRGAAAAGGGGRVRVRVRQDVRRGERARARDRGRDRGDRSFDRFRRIRSMDRTGSRVGGSACVPCRWRLVKALGGPAVSRLRGGGGWWVRTSRNCDMNPSCT